MKMGRRKWRRSESLFTEACNSRGRAVVLRKRKSDRKSWERTTRLRKRAETNNQAAAGQRMEDTDSAGAAINPSSDGLDVFVSAAGFAGWPGRIRKVNFLSAGGFPETHTASPLVKPVNSTVVIRRRLTMAICHRVRRQMT